MIRALLTRFALPLGAALLVGLLTTIVVQAMALRRVRGELADAGLRADSLEAAHAAQRRVLVGELELQARRIVQVTLARDSIDRALQGESRARYRLELLLAAAELRDTAPVASRGGADGDSVRTAHFDVRQTPYTVAADVALPRAPAVGTIGLSIAMDPLELRARVVCGPAAASGIRPAELLVETPPWARVELRELAQDPAVCQAPPGLPPRTRSGWRVPAWLAGVAAVAGYIGGLLTPTP